MNAPVLPTTQPVENQAAVQSLWGAALQPAGCPACRQAFLVPPGQLGRPCPNCWNGKLAPQPALLRKEPPELLEPFAVRHEHLLAFFKKFTSGVWLHTDDFTPESLASRAAPIYWPMWLVDSDLSGDWKAEVGFDYQVKSSQEAYGSAGWQSRERIETRIRWEPRIGQLNRHYDNVAVPALNEHTRLLSCTGAYPMKNAGPYKPELLGQAIVRVPNQNPESAWPLAQDNLKKAAGDQCMQAASGQHINNFSIQPQYANLNWTQLLLPMYVSYYTNDAGQPVPVYLNAQMGGVGGLRMASQRKGWMWAGITAGIGLVLAVLGLLGFALTVVFPPAAAIGILLAVVGLLMIVLAVIPAAWPWQWNRGQGDLKIH